MEANTDKIYLDHDPTCNGTYCTRCGNEFEPAFSNGFCPYCGLDVNSIEAGGYYDEEDLADYLAGLEAERSFLKAKYGDALPYI